MVPPASVDVGLHDRSVDERREFEANFRLVSRSAFLLARQLGRTTDQARDIVQDAALRAWRYRSTREGEFRRWFLAIVYRQCRSRVPEWLPLPTGLSSHDISFNKKGTRGYSAALTETLILDTTDVDADHAALKDAGVDVDEDVSRFGGPVPPMFWLRDPDGNSLIIVQPSEA